MPTCGRRDARRDTHGNTEYLGIWECEKLEDLRSELELVSSQPRWRMAIGDSMRGLRTYVEMLENMNGDERTIASVTVIDACRRRSQDNKSRHALGVVIERGDCTRMLTELADEQLRIAPQVHT